MLKPKKKAKIMAKFDYISNEPDRQMITLGLEGRTMTMSDGEWMAYDDDGNMMDGLDYGDTDYSSFVVALDYVLNGDN